MKKILVPRLTLSLLFTACGVVQPAAQTEPPTPIIQTVVVVATTEPAPPTSIPLPTQGPTNTPIPLPTETATSQPPTAEPPTAAPQSTATVSVGASDLTPVHVDNILGKGVFADISFSSDRLTLNCYPREMEITLRAIDPDVTRAEMFYRMVEVPSYFRYSDFALAQSPLLNRTAGRRWLRRSRTKFSAPTATPESSKRTGQKCRNSCSFWKQKAKASTCLRKRPLPKSIPKVVLAIG